MAWEDPQLRNWTPQDMPQGQLAPSVEPGGHIFDAIAKALSAMRPQEPEFGPAWALSDIQDYIDRGQQGPILSPHVAQQMQDQAMSLAGGTQGMTKISGAPGGSRLIQSFHDKTGELLGSLGYKDFPGKGAVFQSLQSQKPRATAELLTRFADEMGPLMNDVKVAPPIMPQAIPNFQSWINRGRLDLYPDLKARLQGVLNESKQLWGEEAIPKNTYALAKGDQGISSQGYRNWAAEQPAQGVSRTPNVAAQQFQRDWPDIIKELRGKSNPVQGLGELQSSGWLPPELKQTPLEEIAQLLGL